MLHIVDEGRVTLNIIAVGYSMAGGHHRSFHFLSRGSFIIPNLRSGVIGQFLPVVENTKPLENSSDSTDPLLVPKLNSKESGAADRVVKVSVLQSGSGTQSKTESKLQNDESESSSESDTEPLELSPEEDKAQQKLIDEAFSKPIRVKSLDLIGKRKSDAKETKQPKKKLKTYGMKVI